MRRPVTMPKLWFTLHEVTRTPLLDGLEKASRACMAGIPDAGQVVSLRLKDKRKRPFTKIGTDGIRYFFRSDYWVRQRWFGLRSLPPCSTLCS